MLVAYQKNTLSHRQDVGNAVSPLLESMIYNYEAGVYSKQKAYSMLLREFAWSRQLLEIHEANNCEANIFPESKI